MNTWRVNGIDLAVTAAGSGPLVVLAHGFPDLAVTWRLQVPALVAAGYRVLAPDMRGYGASARPDAVEAYDSDTVAADLVGLLDHEGVERAHFVGHDWGAASVWALGLAHPGRVRSLTGISVPHRLPPPVSPVEILRRRFGEDFYMVRFQERDVPEAELGADVARSLRTLLSGTLDHPDDALGVPEWLPEDVFAGMVAQFARTGFGGGLHYYRNLDANRRIAARRTDHAIAAPSLFVVGSADPVATFLPLDDSPRAFRDLTAHTLDGAGHWVHQERPDEVNALVLDHLRRADGG